MAQLGRGLILSSPRPYDARPLLPGYRPPFAVPHAPKELSLRPWAIQGTPRRPYRRSGVRRASWWWTRTPPTWSYLLVDIPQRGLGRTGVPARALIARHALPPGIYHDYTAELAALGAGGANRGGR